jgi:hypothetical protein
VDFVNRQGWGYIKDVSNVAGFQPHAFREIPPLEIWNPIAETTIESAVRLDTFRGEYGDIKLDKGWQVTRLELVSLLRHDEPLAYISDSLPRMALPRMDNVTEYPTRPLDLFESRGLKSLQVGEDIVSESSINSVRMLGSLRAAKQCAKCHQVERGELLGAFSYLLERANPVREPQQEVQPLY